MTPQALDELELNLPGAVLVDIKNPMLADSNVASGNIGTKELEKCPSSKIQQKWRFE